MTWLSFEFWWHDFLSFLIGTLIVFVLIITLFCVFTLTSWPFTCCIYVTLCNCIVPYIALLFFRFKINIVFKIQGRTCYKPAFPCLVKPDAITSLSVHLLIDTTRIMECLLCVGTILCTGLCQWTKQANISVFLKFLLMLPTLVFSCKVTSSSSTLKDLYDYIGLTRTLQDNLVILNSSD